MNQLEAIEARLKGATPGEWIRDPIRALVVSKDRTICKVAHFFKQGGYQATVIDDANATLIAHAPADLEMLLAVVRAAGALTEPTSPIRGLGACCIYCGEEVLNDGHHSECPWLEFQAVLAPLLKEVDGNG